MTTNKIFALFLVFAFIFQAVLLILTYKYPRRNEWDTDTPVLLIDLDFLEKLSQEECEWNGTAKIKIGIDETQKVDKSVFNHSPFEVVFYSNNDSKDFLEFHEEPRRIIPKNFERRWVGNFEIPTNTQRFAEFWKRSKYVECLGLEMNRNKSEKAYQNGPYSATKLAELRDELVDMGMYPFLNGGTFLGWYRECTVIPHTYDMDIAVFKENYNPEYAEKVLNGESDFGLRRKFGMLEDSLELTLYPYWDQGLSIDLFVMYDGMENGTLTHHYVSGVNSDGTKYRYTYPMYDPWCAAVLHDHIFWVSCSPMKQLKHEYGPLWYLDHPTSRYDWSSSGKNVKIVGKFSKEEMEKYYLYY
ncbi:hypothetical protein GCK72_000304 [Caenorhabditis remanei]|uniref:W02B3.4-like N-terminal domain-containing protein n=1 Tax=Caenorhabditis remanei TaxID=31234 RepID=A0A6A5HRV9_CAERE|nr:hypothetical protein GCK72_000304 [Caenorhabditis remanei]KAF1768492.1 hypothetical protein GCK72_000304 [Caenorhabditis remanei]